MKGNNHLRVVFLDPELRAGNSTVIRLLFS